MSRLFITQKEIDFINDTAKELVKDVIGQKIYYYPISEAKSKVHDVYEESPEKIFDNPIEIDALVKYQAQEVRTNQFGSEESYNIECYIQSKDLFDKEIEILEGDFFSYGTVFFEVIKAPITNTIFGQIENKSFITVTGKQSRKRQFLSKVFGPKGIQYTEDDAVQSKFAQQRGFASNSNGETEDVRDMVKNGVLEKPLTQPKEVNTKKSSRSSFYDEDAENSSPSNSSESAASQFAVFYSNPDGE